MKLSDGLLHFGLLSVPIGIISGLVALFSLPIKSTFHHKGMVGNAHVNYEERKYIILDDIYHHLIVEKDSFRYDFKGHTEPARDTWQPHFVLKKIEIQNPQQRKFRYTRLETKNSGVRADAAREAFAYGRNLYDQILSEISKRENGQQNHFAPFQ